MVLDLMRIINCNIYIKSIVCYKMRNAFKLIKPKLITRIIKLFGYIHQNFNIYLFTI